ncbi:MAG: HEPN domain-containing protein [Acidobacteria bacterium]|nr:HEPN domain-containing protein [Acidobacteriota bacterium]
MTGLEEARRWLQAAEDDLRFARFAADGEFFAQACFFAQQAAEKAVKAVHYAGGARAILGHSVRGLIERLGKRAPEIAALLDDARQLDLYYVPTRYPNGLEEGTPAEAFSRTQAGRALESAAAIVTAAGKQVGARPPAPG